MHLSSNILFLFLFFIFCSISYKFWTETKKKKKKKNLSIRYYNKNMYILDCDIFSSLPPPSDHYLYQSFCVFAIVMFLLIVINRFKAVVHFLVESSIIILATLIWSVVL